MSSSTSAPRSRRRRSNCRNRLQRGAFSATKASRSTPATLPYVTSANPYGTGSASPPARPATSSASGPPGAELPGAGPPRTATPRPAAQRARVPGTGTDNQVITGEAVALDLAPASALSRLMSGVIDLILYASTGAAVLILATGFAANDAQLNTMAIGAFADRN